MSALTRWVGSEDHADPSGTGTFFAAGWSLELRMQSFAHAQELAKLIGAAEQMAGDRARRAAALYLRGAAKSLEDQG